jgi:hypothetical protein
MVMALEISLLLNMMDAPSKAKVGSIAFWTGGDNRPLPGRRDSFSKYLQDKSTLK